MTVLWDAVCLVHFVACLATEMLKDTQDSWHNLKYAVDIESEVGVAFGCTKSKTDKKWTKPKTAVTKDKNCL